MTILHLKDDKKMNKLFHIKVQVKKRKEDDLLDSNS